MLKVKLLVPCGRTDAQGQKPKLDHSFVTFVIVPQQVVFLKIFITK